MEARGHGPTANCLASHWQLFSVDRTVCTGAAYHEIQSLNLNAWNFYAEIQTAKVSPVLLSNLSGCTIGHGPVWQNNLPPIFTLLPNGPCQICYQLLKPFTVWHPLCSTSFTALVHPLRHFFLSATLLALNHFNFYLHHFFVYLSLFQSLIHSFFSPIQFPKF